MPIEAPDCNLGTPAPYSGLPQNEAMEMEDMKSLDEIYIPNGDTKAWERSTIFEDYPKIWRQLVDYNINPSSWALDDLKVLLMMPRTAKLDDNKVEITHDVAMLLRRNQLIRMDERKKRFIARRADESVVVPESPKQKKQKPKKEKEKAIDFVRTDEPTPAPFDWEPANGKQ